MKKLIAKIGLLACLCLCCVATAMAQGGKKTLFNANGKATTPSANLDNLFRNFPIMVQNANRVKFVSYQNKGYIKSGRQAASYLKKNFQKGPQWRMVMKEAGKQDAKGNLTKRVAEIDTDVIPFAKEKYQMAAEQWGETMVGYEVFQVKLLLDMKPYTYYIFVDSQTNNVFLQGNIFGAVF